MPRKSSQRKQLLGGIPGCSVPPKVFRPSKQAGYECVIVCAYGQTKISLC